MEKKVKVIAPATVANVACGFDVLGLCLESPGDEITMTVVDKPGITITNNTPYTSLPTDPEQNSIGVALSSFLEYLGREDMGVDIVIEKKIKPGSGVGSSSASSAAAVVGGNHLLGNPLSRKELVSFAMKGEEIACGSAHADNVAPAILGGFALIRSYAPLDVVKLPFPEGLYCAVVHPDIEVKTEDARKVLKRSVPLKSAIVQWGNVGGLVAGLYSKDFNLIARSLEDVIIEPIRSILIPGYHSVKEAALDSGALGCSISGSGPSMFALCRDADTATAVAKSMREAFDVQGIANMSYVSPINANGTQVMDL